ncbi:unnamed protein product [Urochloa decumbens]|uniref:non-specific serine/threonine protein kinase n=1 Tax=Urochloa decumbens TaxID=240449 RepID=A0ABC9AYT9_9POAL
MADPVATVERIVKIGLKIKDAVDTVRHNEDECRDIRKRVLRFSAILSQLQQTGMVNGSSAMSGALEDLEETLEQALKLVAACQQRTTIRRLIAAGDLAKQLRRVKDDILNKVMLASFAINAHTTIVLLTIQASGHPLPRQDTGMTEISHDIQSTHDARSELNGEKNRVRPGSEQHFAILFSLKKFGLSEIKTAMDDKNIIGMGGSCRVYKGVLNDGKVVAIKKFPSSSGSTWARIYDQQLLASKLEHKNIVKVLGYGRGVQESGNGYQWVEEYMPNGSLDKITRESQLAWPSIFRIIEGVAQGVHYLHEQHVVHMDVKPSNILLDSDMNPKITDFNISVVLQDDETTHQDILGTMGYIPPECFAEGIISMMNDVYAFGATVINTIRVMCKNEQPSDERLLYSWAWDVWEAGQMDGVFDPKLYKGSQLREIIRCVEVGLLCLSDRGDRPTMADVLEMLHGKKRLPILKKPAYMESESESESEVEKVIERPRYRKNRNRKSLCTTVRCNR